MSSASAVAWVAPARVVVDRLGIGMDALWAVLYAAQIAALQLAELTPLDEERPLSGAAWDLQEALEELEWVRPELAVHGVALDLDRPLDRIDACREALAEVLRGAAGGGGDAPRGRRGPRDHRAALPAHATTLIGTAHVRITGRPG
jgi:hypothetical protein